MNTQDRDVFVVACDTLCDGASPLGVVSEEGQPLKWLTFDTRREAQMDVIDDLEERIRQFKAGERDFELIGGGEFVLEATLHPDGSISGEDFELPPPAVYMERDCQI